MEDNKDNNDNNLPQSNPVVNYGNKKLKFPQDESNFSINSNGGVQVVVEVDAPNVIRYEEAWRNEFVRERQESAKLEVEKPKPKYTKQKLTNVGVDNNFIPNHWGQLMDVTKIATGGGVASYPIFVPTPTPGPCCMNDIYEHKSSSTFGMGGVGTYKWDATAGSNFGGPINLPYGSTIPYVNGIFDKAILAGEIDDIQQVGNQMEFGVVGPQKVTWSGTIDYNNFRNLSSTSQNIWGFPKFVLKYLTGNYESTGLQTNLDWSNSNMKYENNSVSAAYFPWFWYSFYNIYFHWPDVNWSNAIKPNVVPLYSEAPHLNPLSTNSNAKNHIPFCQGRALIGAGVPHWPNPHPSWTHTYPASSGPNPTGKIQNPRRLGWEGWVLRPHNVTWNWGNQGAFVDTLHYTLGCSEDASSSPTTNNYFHTDEWGMQHCKDGTSSSPTVYDGKSCAAGYCYYPMPSLIVINGGFYNMPGNQFYKGPHIDPTFINQNFNNNPTGGGSLLQHQRACCSNSQSYQNARVMRKYSESTWNMIGSPFAGGNTGITYNLASNVQAFVDLTTLPNGLVGENGNGPPDGQSSNVKYSCTTYYSLNRLLQYISSQSDFEEISARDFGTGPTGIEFSGNYAKRIWVPVQSGYYDKNNPDTNYDDPWENLYRLSDVGKFYAMVNFCDDNSRERATNGYHGNLGNPPIAELNPISGEPESKLNPGIWPWGHCISYACGNPEYSINYQDSAMNLTVNKLGERGCEAQTPWASMPLNYYYSNITFSGIKVFFWDEDKEEQTFKILPKWSFGNSNEWSGQVPVNYSEASESAIGFMMWLGDRSWDYGVQSLDSEGNSLTPPLNNSGMPKSNSGGTSIEWWEPKDGSPDRGVPTLEGHFVYALSDMGKTPSTNGYYKGIRPNFTYLDVVEHLRGMGIQFPLKIEGEDFDYNNRPTGVPNYLSGMAVPGTEKVGNPQTGIPADWHANINSEPNNSPGWNAFAPGTVATTSVCYKFPGEGWTNFSNNNGGNANYNDSSWGTFSSGEGRKSAGNPGGGNYCKQSVMTTNQFVGAFPQSFYAAWGNLGMTPNCANWTGPGKSYNINSYLNGCFSQGTTGSNNVTWPGNITGLRFRPGNIMGVWNPTCQCKRWPDSASAPTAPQLITGPHCEGCNIGCCTNEFNAVSSTLCEYVYPQGLFKSKDDCKRVYLNEPQKITNDTYSYWVKEGREKNTTTPLGDTTFCKLRPPGIVGCIDPGALNFDPLATEDCSGSISHTYANPFTLNVNLNLNIDKSCCNMSDTGYRCDQYNNGCHSVANLWDVTTRAGSPNNGIFQTMADCLVEFPTAASCSQELKKRFVKACPCGDPYIAPEHEVLTHKWIAWGIKPGIGLTVPPQIFHAYDETTYWGNTDITLRRGRLWWGTGNNGSPLLVGPYGNDPYTLNGGVQQGPITRQYQGETWWRSPYNSDWDWPHQVGCNSDLDTYNYFGRINWGVNGSNSWEEAPSGTVEYQDCCLSHAYMYPGSKMFAGWITINGESPEPGQSFRPMEHISKQDWQDDAGTNSMTKGQSLNANVPYIVSYVADWEPNVNSSNVITNKDQVTQSIVGAFGMDVLEASLPSVSAIPDHFLNSVNPTITNNGAGLEGWKRGQMITSSNDFTFVACPNPSPAWGIYGQYGKPGGPGNKQFPKPAYQANPLGNCQGLFGANPNCSNAAGHESALRPAPGTTNAKMPEFDFQGNWTNFNQTAYHESQAGGSWYQDTHFNTYPSNACTWPVPNNKIQKIFAQPIHYAWHCAPPKWLWKDHGAPSQSANGWDNRPLAHPPARNTGGISRPMSSNKNIDIKGLPWYTGAMYSTGFWPWQIAWGKWLNPWVYAEGQNEQPDYYQTFMGCFDKMEQLNQNLPTNVG